MSKKDSFKISAKKQFEFDVVCKSLVGKELEIVDSKNKNQIGMKGILIFESANLFYLKVGDLTKRVLKSNLVIEFMFEDKKLRVNANLLSNSLISRIKKIK